MTKTTTARRFPCPCRGGPTLAWSRTERVCPCCTRFTIAGRDPDPDPPAGPSACLILRRPTAAWPGAAAA